MDFKGKLVFVMLLAVALIGCLSLVAQADGSQPCKFINVKEIENGLDECAKCCKENGMVNGTTVNACRCISHYYE